MVIGGAGVVALAAATPVVIPTTVENNFKLQPQALEKAITSRTKWVILNSPSNPTGSAYSAAELKAILEKDPPHGAQVSFEQNWASSGWDAPALAPWLEPSLDLRHAPVAQIPLSLNLRAPGEHIAARQGRFCA